MTFLKICRWVGGVAGVLINPFQRSPLKQETPEEREEREEKEKGERREREEQEKAQKAWDQHQV